MLFNSFEFAIFLPIVFTLYWFVAKNSLKGQNLLILISSYIFYGYWDYRFLLLLFFSTFLDYFTGLRIYKSENYRTRRAWLYLSIIINIGFLGVFKYYNFFIESFASLLTSAGLTANLSSLNFVLPVGISFYTFHGLSYVFDINKKKITPTKNFIDYSVFVSFFPLLVAGPIERATHLLPQVQNPRIFSVTTATDGLKQILWGLFKKIVIADNCAGLVTNIFSNYEDQSGSTLLLGAILFTFQIYGDFSGYTDIAIGTARLFGFELLKNFSYPYFSRDIAEFWRRWHISLSSWFKDYLYIPLGGSKVGTLMKIRNTFIIFFVSGFWHGANWTFIIWGLLNAIYFIPLMLFKKNRANLGTVAEGKLLPSFFELVQMGSTFFLTMLAWIFFRSETVGDALLFISLIFSKSIFSNPFHDYITIISLIIIFMSIEWLGREKEFAISIFSNQKNKIVRHSLYYAIAIAILVFGHFGENQFIYFQF